ncbi:hypothetical protein KORDIASMS9_00009 [Kordia sp. SMS9]|uniref:hypothetical protein n=1 Tax=Kordia sp. SMS9 TaxID=2282170 RepID=UPI000E0DDCA3|nr:hypothetical protein [Kordia sp. SMS9]AXG67827.1 hypothetical protein KORDIASMS9_00009 [Kordia sp. SMS9]
MNIQKILRILPVVAVCFIFSCENTTAERNEDDFSKRSNTQLEQTVIAEEKEGQIVFMNEEQLMSQLEHELTALQKPNVNITDVRIDTSVAVDDDRVTVLQLIGSSQNETVKISYVVMKENSKFYMASEETVLVCEGCRSGCSPRRKENGDGYCTACDYQAKKCTKTETLPAFTD